MRRALPRARCTSPPCPQWLLTIPSIEEGDIQFLDFCAEGRRLAGELAQQGAELIVALTHMRTPNDLVLAANVPEIQASTAPAPSACPPAPLAWLSVRRSACAGIAWRVCVAGYLAQVGMHASGPLCAMRNAAMCPEQLSVQRVPRGAPSPRSSFWAGTTTTTKSRAPSRMAPWCSSRVSSWAAAANDCSQRTTRAAAAGS